MSSKSSIQNIFKLSIPIFFANLVIPFVAEGVEGMVPYKGKIEDVAYQLVGGLRSSMGYTGHKTIKKMQGNCKFVFISKAGARESNVCLLYTSPSPRDGLLSRMPSSA